MTVNRCVLMFALVLTGSFAVCAASAPAPPLDPHYAKHKAAVETYAECMDTFLKADEERTVEDGRGACAAELDAMKATIPEPEWKRALGLIEDAIPEIKKRQEQS